MSDPRPEPKHLVAHMMDVILDTARKESDVLDLSEYIRPDVMEDWGDDARKGADSQPMLVDDTRSPTLAQLSCFQEDLRSAETHFNTIGLLQTSTPAGPSRSLDDDCSSTNVDVDLSPWPRLGESSSLGVTPSWQSLEREFAAVGTMNEVCLLCLLDTQYSKFITILALAII